MKLEKWSWIAGIVAAIVAVLAWLVDRNDFIAFCKTSGKIIITPFSIAFNWLGPSRCFLASWQGTSSFNGFHGHKYKKRTST